MRKFTVFTVILTVVVVVMSSEIFVDKYLPNSKKPQVDDSSSMALNLPDKLDISDATQTNVLGADIDYSEIQNDSSLDVGYEAVEVPLDISQDVTITPDTLSNDVLLQDDNDPNDFESQSFASSPSTSVLIREDQVRSAGFASAYLETEAHNGFLYKTIYIDDIEDVTVTKTAIKSGDTLLVKVYVFQIGTINSVDQVYEILKLRGSEGLNTEVNETNEYGNGSFFINDSQRQNVAFLTVKIGALIYGFSYPKEYHAQVKNLVALLDIEF